MNKLHKDSIAKTKITIFQRKIQFDMNRIPPWANFKYW